MKNPSPSAPSRVRKAPSVKDANDTVTARPFFKTPGGKTRLLPELRSRLPARFEHYHEPFVGGGALFWDLATSFRLRTNYASLSDANPVIPRAFRAVKDNVEEVISRLEAMPVTQDHYMAIRGTTTESRAAMGDAELCAWFLFVNKTGYNGMFRVNREGKFNIPWGKWERQKRSPTVLDAPLLRACSAVLQRLRVSATERSFEAVLHYARRGDLVYFDPPYLPVSSTSDFTAYTKEGFSYDDHVRLRDVALELKNKGIHVMVSNSDVPLVRELYERPGFLIDVVMAPRSVNSKGDRRGDVRELVIR